MALWGKGHATYQRSGENGNTLTKTKDGVTSMYGAEWIDGDAQSLYQWKMQQHKGKINNIFFGFIAPGHHEDVDKNWSDAGPSYAHELKYNIFKDGNRTTMKEPKISLKDEVVYSLDIIKKEIRVRINAGDDVVLLRDISVGNGTRYKLAMMIYYKNTNITFTQLHSNAHVQLQIYPHAQCAVHIVPFGVL